MAFVTDLHMHSNFSDGFWSPRVVVEHAREAGLKQISISDHNTIEGQGEAREAANVWDLD